MKEIKKRLEGKKLTVSDRASDRAKYAEDFSMVPQSEPALVVHAKTGDEISEAVIAASDSGIPVYAVSSKVHFNGGTIPRKGGITLDLTSMNTIHRIDQESRWGHLECGVTWEQYANALKEVGGRSAMPLLPHADRSVVMDWLEREVCTIPVFEYAEQLSSLWVVWGNGEKFVTGSGAVNTFGQPDCFADGVNPQGPGTVDFWRLLQGSQGTLGLVYKAVVKYEQTPKLEKTFFVVSDTLDELIDPLYDLLHRRVGLERFVVNNMVLASMLGADKKGIADLRAKLPAYTTVLVIGGFKRRPEERLAYQEDYINETWKKKFPQAKLVTKLDAAPGLEKKLPEMLRNPWPKDKTYWKHAYKGNCQELTFMTTLDRASKFNDVVLPIAAGKGYPAEDVGIYIQPVEEGRACQLTYSFYYGKADAAKVLDLYRTLIPAVYNAGGFFNKPYEWIAQFVYPKAPDYTATLMRVKKLFDPNMVLGPGKLCF